MDRRHFPLTSLAGTLAEPLAAEAQQAAKLWPIGVLNTADGPEWEVFRPGPRRQMARDGWWN